MISFTRTHLILVLACAGLVLLFAGLRAADAPAGAAAPATAPAAPDAAADSSPPGTQTATAHPLPLTADDQVLIEQLRGRFAGRIDSPHAQIKLLEQLQSYLMALYPEDWQARIGVFLRALFPQLAQDLESQFHKLMQHNDWLRTHRDDLLQLPPAERRQQLWDARRAVFGAQAEQIWAAELKNQAVQDTLLGLEDAAHLTVQEKFSQYLASVQQAHGEQAAALLQRRQTELLNRFLEVGSVQSDLQAQAPDQRQASLRALRHAMGMDQAALERWSAVDRARDTAWERGQGYERERARILAESAEAEREKRLQALRRERFGDEAELIAAEEASGFYRYQRERRIGRE
ncbi:MAG: hypothetical protein ACLGHI_08960 [Gammaproteobacteria bacterium]